MSKAPSEPRFVKIVDGPTQPSGLGIGYVVVGIMSILLLVANTYGFSQAFRLPALFGLVLAILTLVIRLYLLRPRPAHERASSSGLDRMMFYLLPAFLSTLFSAFAIYCVALSGQPERFLRDTMALTGEAIGCWAAPGILELFIVILVLGNRPHD